MSPKQTFDPKTMPDCDEFSPVNVNPQQILSQVKMKLLDSPDNELAKKTSNVF